MVLWIFENINGFSLRFLRGFKGVSEFESVSRYFSRLLLLPRLAVQFRMERPWGSESGMGRLREKRKQQLSMFCLVVFLDFQRWFSRDFWIFW